MIRPEAAFVAALFSLAGCCRTSGSTPADVSCWWMNGEVLCDVSNKTGEAPMSICWHVGFTCLNGTKGSGSACKVVAPGKTEQQHIAAASVVGSALCDQASEVAVDSVRASLTAP